MNTLDHILTVVLSSPVLVALITGCFAVLSRVIELKSQKDDNKNASLDIVPEQKKQVKRCATKKPAPKGQSGNKM